MRRIPIIKPIAPTIIVAIIISFILLTPFYINPEKPIKAIAINPAVIRTIGEPWNDTGISLLAIFSLIPAIITIAIVNPKAVPKLQVENEKTTRKVAFVHCNGTCKNVTTQYIYHGIKDCNNVSIIIIALLGQLRAHKPQPIQLTLQSFRALNAGVLELHLTIACF